MKNLLPDHFGAMWYPCNPPIFNLQSSIFNLHHSSAAGRRGFTLIEILVASLLLGMLMTILTMVFNSSAIAWRTGKASNSMMSQARRQLSYSQYLADNALPRVDTKDKSKTGRVLGPWDGKGELRKRAVEIYPAAKFQQLFDLPEWDSLGSNGSSVPQPWQEVRNIKKLRADGDDTYVVGVLSWGPDGNLGTTDDINTMPVLFE